MGACARRYAPLGACITMKVGGGEMILVIMFVSLETMDD